MKSKSYRDYNQHLAAISFLKIDAMRLQDWFLSFIFAVHLRE
jgi:hypothetical protein